MVRIIIHHGKQECNVLQQSVQWELQIRQAMSPIQNHPLG